MDTEAKASCKKDNLEDGILEYRQQLINVAYRITNDKETAKDIVQDACLAIIKVPDQYKGTASLKTYLYRIVINRSIDSIRKIKRTRNLLEIFYRDYQTHSSQGDKYDNKELVRHIFAKIPSQFRIPLILAEVEGMSYEEIADVLKLSLNTVRTRIFRCREKMRKELDKLEVFS